METGAKQESGPGVFAEADPGENPGLQQVYLQYLVEAASVSLTQLKIFPATNLEIGQSIALQPQRGGAIIPRP